MLLAKLLALGHGLRALDVGFGAGELARRIRPRCAHLAGIEMDAAAASQASHFFDSCLTGDLMSVLPQERGPYDVIVAGDVLEHLPDPGAVLDMFRGLLGARGLLLVSLPNVANVTVRAALLLGRFTYTERGILDATHLRFFTGRTGRELLESHGFRVTSQTATAMPLELAAPFLGSRLLAPAVRGGAVAAARLWPGLLGYQFVYEAVPR